MKILSPALFNGATNIVLYSRKEARRQIQIICPKDIYTGRVLDKGVWTLEHVVPQSRITHPGQKNDLHNLGGLHTRINSSRGNKKFGDPSVYRNFMGCKVSPTLFCPMVGKGEVSRKCAYMIEMYGNHIDSLMLIDRETMMEWNDMYPPLEDEKRKNSLIFELQGTYNRFIEDSSLLQETLYCKEVKNNQNKGPGTIKISDGSAPQYIEDNKLSQNCPENSGMVLLQEEEGYRLGGFYHNSPGKGIQENIRRESRYTRV